MFFLHGDGRNGKSVLVETILAVMGEYAGVAGPDLIMARKNTVIPVDVANLRGRRAVFMNETSQGKRFDEEKLKNLTGGDKLQARFMRENLFEFAPTHKLVLRGNHKPGVLGTDEGIWSRLRLFPFDLRLAVAERDRHLKRTLARETSGILAWMVRGCLAWQTEGGLQTPAKILQAVEDYRAESDTLGAFLEEKCERKIGARCQSSVLYKKYREHCEATSDRYMPNKDFPHELEKRGIKRVKSHGAMYFQGIEVKAVFAESEKPWFDVD